MCYPFKDVIIFDIVFYCISQMKFQNDTCLHLFAKYPINAILAIFRLHPKTTGFFQKKFFSFFFLFFRQRKNKQIKKYYNIFDQYRP